jgi:hypothetical protein
MQWIVAWRGGRADHVEAFVGQVAKLGCLSCESEKERDTAPLALAARGSRP